MTKRYLDDTVSYNYEQVDHPNHYQSDDGKMEVQDIITGFNLSWNLGNVCKYILRAGRKPGADKVEDLRKASKYLEYEILKITGGDRT